MSHQPRQPSNMPPDNGDQAWGQWVLRMMYVVGSEVLRILTMYQVIHLLKSLCLSSMQPCGHVFSFPSIMQHCMNHGGENLRCDQRMYYLCRIQLFWSRGTATRQTLLMFPPLKLWCKVLRPLPAVLLSDRRPRASPGEHPDGRPSCQARGKDHLPAAAAGKGEYPPGACFILPWVILTGTGQVSRRCHVTSRCHHLCQPCEASICIPCRRTFGPPSGHLWAHVQCICKICHHQRRRRDGPVAGIGSRARRVRCPCHL